MISMKKLLVILIFLLTIGSVFAANTTYTCLDSSVSQHSRNWIEDSVVQNTTENITCSTTCNSETGQCYQTGSFDIGVSLGLTAIIFLFIYLGINLREQWAISFLFLMMSQFLIFLNVSMLTAIGQAGNSITGDIMQSSLWAFMGILLVVTLYYILQIIYKAITILQARAD